jgi:type I restriction enzyme S subunit
MKQQDITRPSDWVETTLGEVAEIRNGKTNSQDAINDGEYPLFDRSSVIKKSDKFIFDTSAIIVPGEGAEFIPRYFEGKFDLHQRAYAIHNFKKNIADPIFFFYQIINNRSYFEKIAVGSTVKSLRINHFIEFPILLPPLPEQKAIASILSAFDDKIELLREQNKTLEEIGQTIFKEWFGKYGVDDELPEGWRVGKVENIFDFLEGPGIRNWQYTERGTRFINIRLIQNGDILVKNSNFVSDEEASGKYKHFMLQERDFVLSTSGTLGRGAIVRKEHLPLMLNTSVIRFRPKDEISYAFMYLFLQSPFFIHELESLASGSVQLNFGPIHLRQIKMIIPSDIILKNFAEGVNPIFEKMSDNFSQIQSLARSRDELLPKLMSGHVRVNGFE